MLFGPWLSDKGCKNLKPRQAVAPGSFKAVAPGWSSGVLAWLEQSVLGYTCMAGAVVRIVWVALLNTNQVPGWQQVGVGWDKVGWGRAGCGAVGWGGVGCGAMQSGVVWCGAVQWGGVG